MPGTAERRSLAIRFEISRSEIERLETAARAAGEQFDEQARAGRFDESHLRGRVTFDVGVPFAPDPVLEFLKAKRGLAAGPPISIDLDQPVGYLIGQLASAAVLALHGEGDFSIPLTGGRGAFSLAAREGALELGIPLQQYAGVAAVPAPEAAGAIAAAAGALGRMLASRPALSKWSFLAFLERERAVLEAVAKGPSVVVAPPIFSGLDFVWQVDQWSGGSAADLLAKAAEAEGQGAHVVPYWRVTRLDGDGGVQFAPVRVAGRSARRGALALCIFPAVERLIELEVHGDGQGTRRLVERLKKPVPFAARILAGGLVSLEELDHALPVA